MTENPYSTPLSETTSNPGSGPAAGSTTLGSIAKTTFLAWERLRIPFVIILGLLTLSLAGRNLLEPRALSVIVVCAVFANLCFFAGPIVETYVRWLGYEQKWVRWFLFVGGTLLSALLAVATLASMFLPNQF